MGLHTHDHRKQSIGWRNWCGLAEWTSGEGKGGGGGLVSFSSFLNEFILWSTPSVHHRTPHHHHPTTTTTSLLSLLLINRKKKRRKPKLSLLRKQIFSNFIRREAAHKTIFTLSFFLPPSPSLSVKECRQLTWSFRRARLSFRLLAWTRLCLFSVFFLKRGEQLLNVRKENANNPPCQYTHSFP